MRTQIVKKTSLSSNFSFQFLYRILIYFVPLIVSPYLTRVLGNNGLGVYQFSYTFAYYFVLVSMLGIEKYGQRLIATSVLDLQKLRRNFWSLYYFHLFISFFSLILYIFFVSFFVDNNKIIFFLQAIYVLSAMFDVTWFFQGIEDFKSVVIRNSLIKILECILIFAFVKTQSDLWVYTLVSSGAWLLGQLIMLPQIVCIVKPCRVSRYEIIKHIKPLIVLSVAVFATSLYTVFDKTLLGIMTTKENVAYYEYSNKLINLPKMIIAVIGTVLFPRACKLAYENDINRLKKYMNCSVVITAVIGFASVWGFMALSDSIAIVYYGKDFEVCGSVIKALSPNIIIIEMGGILRMQYLIPKKKDKEYTICICLNAIINLIFSLILIPVCGIYGAIIGTTAAELFGLVFQMNLSKEVLSWKELIKGSCPFCVIGMLMFGIIKIMDAYLSMNIMNLLIEIVVGAVFFVGMSLAYIMVEYKELGWLIKNAFFKILIKKK